MTCCPKCSKRPDLVSGALLPNGVPALTYLVCWDHSICTVSTDDDWKPLKRKKSGAIEWRKFTRWHWQTKINGEILDYWPTKNKFRFQDETRKGDVTKFIKGLSK